MNLFLLYSSRRYSQQIFYARIFSTGHHRKHSVNLGVKLCYISRNSWKLKFNKLYYCGEYKEKDIYSIALTKEEHSIIKTISTFLSRISLCNSVIYDIVYLLGDEGGWRQEWFVFIYFKASILLYFVLTEIILKTINKVLPYLDHNRNIACDTVKT